MTNTTKILVGSLFIMVVIIVAVLLLNKHAVTPPAAVQNRPVTQVARTGVAGAAGVQQVPVYSAFPQQQQNNKQAEQLAYLGIAGGLLKGLSNFNFGGGGSSDETDISSVVNNGVSGAGENMIDFSNGGVSTDGVSVDMSDAGTTDYSTYDYTGGYGESMA